MKTRQWLLLLLSVSLLLSGCRIKLKTKEIQNDEYQSIGNELTLFGFGIGENIHNIKDGNGVPDRENDAYYTFAKDRFNVFTSHNISQFLVTDNSQFRVLDSIAVGSTRDQIIHEHHDLDLFEIPGNAAGLSYIFFQYEDQRVVLEMKNQIVQRIYLGSKDVSYDQMIHYKKIIEVQPDDHSDEDFIVSAKRLTFSVNLEKNNKKLLSNEFFKFATLGIIKNVPVPIGMEKNDLIYRFGSPNYLFEGKGKVKVYYFYKRFNIFMGFNKKDKLIELKLPVFLNDKELQQNDSVSKFPKNQPIKVSDYIMEKVESDGEITSFDIRKK